MQALRGSNEAELQRQCAQRPRLSSKGQNYLSDPRDESRSARDEPQLKWATGDLPLDESLWVGISVWESTDVAASDLLCQSPHASYAVCCRRTLNRTLWWKRCMQIEHAWWTHTESRACSEITVFRKKKKKFSKPQIDLWTLRLIFRETKHSCHVAKGVCEKY